MKKLWFIVLGLRTASLVGALLLLPLAAIAGDCGSKTLLKDILQIENTDSVVITPCVDNVVRTQLPDTLFGFNVQHYGFQQDLYATHEMRVRPSVIDALRPFSGALYRYPGGLVSNRFPWQFSVGPVDKRPEVKSVKWDFPAKILFGLDEYLDLVDTVSGQPLYVLNLVGWDSVALTKELDKDLIAATNARLAEYMLARLEPLRVPRYYQLGNELDRAEYQWSHQKYIDRSLASINAMRKVDPDAHFVAFLREFDWTYRGEKSLIDGANDSPAKGGAAQRPISRYGDFIRDVLTGLPMVNDFSLHFYYNARDGQRKTQRMPWRLKQFRSAIETAKSVRAGVSPNVWITEHARGINFGGVKARDARPYTSNLEAAIDTADFLIALAQIPEIKGAAWHGMNAMPWQMFDPQHQLRGSAVYWAMRVLRSTDLPEVMATYTASPNSSVYEDGYDVRAVVLASADKKHLTVWAANHVAEQKTAELWLPSLAGRRVEITHHYVSGKQGVNPDQPDSFPDIMLKPAPQTSWFDTQGRLVLSLPPASVSGFQLELR